MKALLKQAEERQDSIIESHLSGKTSQGDISDFKGISLGGTLQFNDFRAMHKHVTQARDELLEARKKFGQSSVVLSKNFFRNIFDKNTWVTFKNLQDSGVTGGRIPPEMQREITRVGNERSFFQRLKDVLQSSDFIGGGSVVSILAVMVTVGILGDLGRLSEGLFWVAIVVMTVFASVAVIGFMISTVGSYTELSLEERKKMFSNFFEKYKNNLPALFFPSGVDYQAPDGFEDDPMIRRAALPLKISLPEVPDGVKEKIKEVLQHPDVLSGAEVFILAHHKAIGIEYHEDALQVATPPADFEPILGIEYNNVVALFPETSWGEIPEEEEMFAKIEKLVEQEGVALFN